MTDPTQTLVVAADTGSVRLDAYLVQHADLSRTKIQAEIKAGRILVNGQPTKPHHQLHAGDRVVIQNPAMAVHAEAKVIDTLEPTVLFEDDQYLVVNKPSGLLVHGGPGIDEPTLADWAIKHDPAIAVVGDQPDIRPGIVHRLDREVSGVMVIAKTAEAFISLKRQFQDHSIFKQYIALAYGRITDRAGRIDFAIARKPDKSGLMVARPKSTEGKDAETRFHVERFLKNMTLVRVQTLTGRTHQIRVHFKAIGHPLIGDPLYRMKRMKTTKLVPPRLCLHAQVLEFTDLDGQRRHYEASLPADLTQFFSKVG